MKFGKETDYVHTGKLNFADNEMKERYGHLSRFARSSKTRRKAGC